MAGQFVGLVEVNSLKFSNNHQGNPANLNLLWMGGAKLNQQSSNVVTEKQLRKFILVDVVTENVRNGLMSEMLYADDLVLMSETMEGLMEKFWKWKEAFESKGLKVNLGKTKVVVSGAEGEVSVSKVDPCGICAKRVMANSVLCVKCGKWIHGRCAKVKRVTPRLGRDFVCGRCKQVDDGLVEPMEELCEEVKTVRGFCYLGDRVNASGGCEAAVTARARIGWVKFKECRELLNSKRFSLKMKGMVYRSCVRSAMLYGSETWCLRENEMAILRRTERATVRTMCGAKLMDKKRIEDLMEMLELKETVVQMAKTNGVRRYGHVLRRNDGHVLRKALEFEVKGKRKQGRQKMWKMKVEKESAQECWFGEKRCHESSEMESGSWRDCFQSGVNPATPVCGINLDQNYIALKNTTVLFKCHKFRSICM